jgi:poly[(R)-3-hydroxyalkanoate] polymerase subunit PhaC
MPRPSIEGTASAPTTTDSWALPEHYTYVSIDRAFKANLARLTFGVGPVALAHPYFDWLAHLAVSPGKQMQLVENAIRTSALLMPGGDRVGLEPECTRPAIWCCLIGREGHLYLSD